MTTVGGTVIYICDNGYQLSGSPTVTCLASGWSTRPTCTGMEKYWVRSHVITLGLSDS